VFTDTKAFSGFAVDDVQQARAFYGETLGIRTSEAHGLLHLHLAGDRDPFRAGTDAFAGALGIRAHHPRGEHEADYWSAHYARYLRFYASALAVC
ncbi:MAG: hypothetical protein QOE95_2033, partial [Gaiellaceae bacterium]|nr:hypothetical protein [Gaiellaceae bacterium]